MGYRTPSKAQDLLAKEMRINTAKDVVLKSYGKQKKKTATPKVKVVVEVK